MDLVVEKATELGAFAIVPVRSARVIGHDTSPAKVERWRRIAKSAAQQSGRVRVPEIADVCDWDALLATFARYDRVYVPWELRRAVAAARRVRPRARRRAQRARRDRTRRRLLGRRGRARAARRRDARSRSDGASCAPRPPRSSCSARSCTRAANSEAHSSRGTSREPSSRSSTTSRPTWSSCTRSSAITTRRIASRPIAIAPTASAPTAATPVAAAPQRERPFHLHDGQESIRSRPVAVASRCECRRRRPCRTGRPQAQRRRGAGAARRPKRWFGSPRSA